MACSCIYYFENESAFGVKQVYPAKVTSDNIQTLVMLSDELLHNLNLLPSFVQVEVSSVSDMKSLTEKERQRFLYSLHGVKNF